MADADFDGHYGRYAQDRTASPLTGAKAQTYARIAGAVVSLALVAGFAVWGYRLAVRDVRGVPVIQALDGPMRVAPDDPGGEIADHQGLAVNNVAAAGVAAPIPDRLVLAPRPVELTEEDVAGLGGLTPLGPEPVLAPLPEPGVAEVALAAAPQTESASPTEIAIDAALAEALGEIPLEEIAPAAASEPIPDGALVVSPRPKARPASRSAPEPAAAVVVDAPDEIDPSTIPAGTRLVQFGAFDTQDEARAEWVRLSGQFGELLDGKGMVLQPAESGGRTFYRLRAHGFDGEDDARRFCSAFVAQNATCIPVPQR
ncbi:MAG: SPOR domain-containing protein [Tabrizicola sp.]|jgi:hypothetical protein|nr:SPOR domain-containing protein [Tabrizicola sp.]